MYLLIFNSFFQDRIRRSMKTKPKSEMLDEVPSALAEVGDGKTVLKKYAGAVHIGADLTLYQRRAFNVLLFWAMPEMPKTTRHEIDLDSLAWGMGMERASQRMQRLVENLDKMMDARVVWNLLDESGDLEEWESATLLPYVKVSRRDRKVTYEFTRAFQERVYNPSEFAEIALRLQRVFRSEHALALYENTRRFLAQGETPWIAIETFRTLMGVHDKPYYDEYKYLNARLIKPAMQQINESSDVQIRLKTKRKSKVVSEIKFIVEANAQMSLFAESLVTEPTPVSSDETRRLMIRLSGYRITGKRAEQLFERHGDCDIVAALDAADAWMEAKEANHETITNPAGVAYKAITEGWKIPGAQAPAAISEDRVADANIVEGETKALSAERREALRAEFRRNWYKDYIADASVESLNSQKAAFEESLTRSIGDKLVLDRFHKHGLTGIVLGLFQHFLASQGIEPDDAAFEAFLQDKSKFPAGV